MPGTRKRGDRSIYAVPARLFRPVERAVRGRDEIGWRTARFGDDRRDPDAYRDDRGGPQAACGIAADSTITRIDSATARAASSGVSLRIMANSSPP